MTVYRMGAEGQSKGPVPCVAPALLMEAYGMMQRKRIGRKGASMHAQTGADTLVTYDVLRRSAQWPLPPPQRRSHQP